MCSFCHIPLIGSIPQAASATTSTCLALSNPTRDMTHSPIQSIDSSLQCLGIDDTTLGGFQTSIESSDASLDLDWLYHNSSPSMTQNSIDEPQAPTVYWTNNVNEILNLQLEHFTSKLENETHGFNDTFGLVSSASDMTQFTSQGGSDSDSPEFEQANGTAVAISDFEYRYIQRSPISPTPFMKKHFSSKSPLAPFAGPQTPIAIPFGPDLGKYMHLPCTQSVADGSLVELAIFWLATIHSSLPVKGGDCCCFNQSTRCSQCFFGIGKSI
jgi:hypothetical protein